MRIVRRFCRNCFGPPTNRRVALRLLHDPRPTAPPIGGASSAIAFSYSSPGPRDRPPPRRLCHWRSRRNEAHGERPPEREVRRQAASRLGETHVAAVYSPRALAERCLQPLRDAGVKRRVLPDRNPDPATLRSVMSDHTHTMPASDPSSSTKGAFADRTSAFPHPRRPSFPRSPPQPRSA